MKTAISIPDKVYSSAEKLASRLGQSRSQLYTQALNTYISRYQQEGVTAKLNEIYERQSSKLDEPLRELQLKSLTKEDW